MRKLISVAVLVLGGCAGSDDSTSFIAYIERIQLATAATCDFLPTYLTVKMILAGKDYEPSQYEQLAQAICEAEIVQQKTGKPPLIGRIPIIGRFLR